jgi:hypothetical protein
MFNGATLERAVLAAYDAEAYLKEDGTRDLHKLASHIYEVVAPAKVLRKAERDAKAILRGAIVAATFPNLPGPDAWANMSEEDAALAQAIYGKVDTHVWSELTPSYQGRVQKLVGLNMGNGYVLCRTKLGREQNDAVYVTDAKECILLDFTRPDNLSLNRRIQTSTKNREMLVLRQPDNAKAYATEYDKTLKSAQVAARDQLQLTVESATATLEDENANGNGNEE